MQQQSRDARAEKRLTESETNSEGEVADEAAGLGTDAEEQEQYEPFATPVQQLVHQGISAADITRLQEKGYHSMEAVARSHSKRLCTIKGLSENKVKNMKEQAGRHVNMTFSSAATALEKMTSERFHVPTGCSEVDMILDGGFKSSEISEIFGAAGTGKTQLCHHLAVSAQLGENAGNVLVVDTSGRFRADRLVKIAERYGLNPKDVLENVIIGRAHNYEMQIDFLNTMKTLLVQKKFSLILIDSVIRLFRVDFSGRGELAPRQQALGQYVSMLKEVCEEHNLAVVFTNEVMSVPDSFGYGDGLVAAGGHVLAHAVQTRVKLRKGKGTSRVMQVIFGTSLPANDIKAAFEITPGGITDAE